jgi:hypothetical protein
LKIDSQGLSSLEKLVDNRFALVVKYQETWPDIGVGGGLIDGIITKG